MVSSTTARDRESTVIARLAPAAAQVGPGHGEQGDPLDIPLCLALEIRRPRCSAPPQWGRPWPAMRPGLRQESSTVTRENPAAPTKIKGFAEATLTTPFSWATITGVSRPPTSQPITSPSGMPARDSVSAWLADDPPQLPGGGADGLQQAVEPNIIGDGDLEDIVDDEIAGKDDQQPAPRRWRSS